MMKNKEFRTPLLQSAALLVGVIILAMIAASAGNSGGGGILAFIAGIGNTILFIVGLAIGLAICIALLVGIFLAAVAMVEPEQAGQMYRDLKKNFSLQGGLIYKNFWLCCSANQCTPVHVGNDYKGNLEELVRLQRINSDLLININELEVKFKTLEQTSSNLQNENISLKAKIEELQQALQNQDSSTFEPDAKQSSTSGIFAYISNEHHQKLFIDKVGDSLKHEMTYAQIDEYLAENLPPELHKIIKEHPSLTKNYIRSQRKD
jgi:hypothetical protein